MPRESLLCLALAGVVSAGAVAFSSATPFDATLALLFRDGIVPVGHKPLVQLQHDQENVYVSPAGGNRLSR